MAQKFFLILCFIFLLFVSVSAANIDNELMVIQTMVQNGMYDIAAAELEPLIKNNEGNQSLELAYFLLGESYFFLDKINDAEFQYKMIYDNFKKSALMDKVIYRLGTININLKKFTESKKYFDEFIKIYPSSELAAESKFYLGVCNEQLGNYKEAVNFYNLTLEKGYLDKFYQQASYSAGWCYFKLNDFENAVKHLKNVKPENEFIDVYYYLAKSYEKLNDTEKAMKHYEKIPESSEIFKPAYYAKGWLLFDTGKKNEAAEIFEEYIKKFPEDKLAPEAMLTAANIYYELEYFDKSLALFNSYYEKYSEMKDIEKLNLIKSLYFSGYLCIRQYEKNKSKQLLIDAEKKFILITTNFDNKEFTGKSYFRLGQIYGYLEDNSKSAENYKNVIEKYPDNEFAEQSAYEAAKQYYLIKNYESTVKYLKLFKEKFKTSSLISDVNFSLAETYYLMKDWPNSISAYTELLNDKTIDKTRKEYGYFINELAYYKLGWSYNNIQKFEDAIKYFDLLITQYPESGLKIDAVNQTGKIYYDKGEIEKSKKYFSLIEKNGGAADANSKANLAYITFVKAEKDLESKNYESAISNYNESLKLYTELEDTKMITPLLLKIGDIYYSQKKYDEMENFYNGILKNYSNQPDVFLVFQNLGWSNFENKKFDKSIEYMKLFLTGSNKNKGITSAELIEEAMYIVIKSYQNLKNDTEALKEINNYLNSNSNLSSKYYSLVFYNKTLIERILSKFDDSIKSGEWFIQNFPADEFYFSVLYNLMELYSETKQNEKFIESAKKIIEQDSDKIRVANVKFMLIKFYVETNNFDESIKWTENLIEKHPEFKYMDEVLFISAKIHETKKTYDNAIKYLNRILSNYKTSDRYEESLYSYAQMNFIQKKSDESEIYYKKFISEFPKSRFIIGAILDYSDILVAKNDLKTAEEILAKLNNNYEITDGLVSIEAMYKLGLVYFKLNKSEPAIDILTRATIEYDNLIKSQKIQDNDISAKICILKGDVYTTQKNYPKAIFEYQRVVAVYPFKGYIDSAQYKTAEAYIKFGKKNIADILLNKILTEFPDTPLKPEIHKLLELK
ncbi:tetratricopeptide repeat protein [Candidatus Dependentiae bacterium]|nr:tetratricopeptide repeat protein [Candidatus Dependentiae bacterium]